MKRDRNMHSMTRKWSESFKKGGGSEGLGENVESGGGLGKMGGLKQRKGGRNAA